MAFIDGLHTNEQLVKDFIGVSPFLSDRCVVVCHDVASHNLLQGWEQVLSLSSKDGFRGFQISWTVSGACALVRGLPSVKDYFENNAGEFQGYRYYFGIKSSPHRPKFYNRTLYEIEVYVRRKLGLKA